MADEQKPEIIQQTIRSIDIMPKYGFARLREREKPVSLPRLKCLEKKDEAAPERR